MDNLSKRVLVFSISTDSFFNRQEKAIGDQLMEFRIENMALEVHKSIENGVYKKYKNKELHNSLKEKIEILSLQNNKNKLEIIDDLINDINDKVNKLSDELKFLINKNDSIRELNENGLFVEKNGKEIAKTRNVAALFESTLTRTLNLKDTKESDVNEELVIVKVYHQKVLKDLIDKGFTYRNNHYTYLFSSSGQMKSKKCVFAKESALKETRTNNKGEIYTVQDSLMCGLSRERINETEIKGKKGVNTNKFLAYLSLLNSATTEWKEFDIHKVLVVPDLELNVKGTVDYINRDTYEIEPNVFKDDLAMNVTDGCGLMLPKVSNKAFQFRINFGKGLLCPFDFVKFIKKANEENPNKNHAIIRDVWGDYHDVIKEDIQILISSSQLKLWKYYKNWNEYKQSFQDYNCQAGKCNEEVETNDITLNYQYIQSLTNMTYDDLTDIAKMTNDDIENLGSSKEKMLRTLGATDENDNKNNLQQALLIYDNLLNDPHVKTMIKNKKAAMITDAKGGSLRVEGKRMFVLPDVYGWCEFLFKEIKNPKGLLSDGKVFSKNLREGEVNLLRSPQLFREHGLAKNIHNDDLNNWFVSGGLYVSNWSLLSRLLQFDWDGDQVNVCTNKRLITVAKDAMEGINPLFYEMSVAPVQPITEDTIYKSLTLAFNGNIGTISNDITRIYNSAGDFTKDKLTAVKMLTMYNNFMIDFSKTNFLPKPNKKAKQLINQFTKGKVPYFFQYAKGYDKEDVAYQVVKDDNGEYTPAVNMLEDIISTKNIYFRKVADKLDYIKLMSVKEFTGNKDNPELYDAIKKSYDKINKNKKWMIDKDDDEYKENKYIYVAKMIKEEIMSDALKINKKVNDEKVADMLIYYLYKEKKSNNKKTLFESFGDIIVANLKWDVNGVKDCANCNNEFEAQSHKEKYCCEECKHEGAKKSKKKWKKKISR